MGSLTRLWLFTGTTVQSLLTAAAAISIWQSHEGSVATERADPSWGNLLSFVCLAFMSASLGVQGIMGKRLNTQFTTTSVFKLPSPWIMLIAISITVVLTTVWVELMSDPLLFNLRHKVKTRDHKLIAASSLFIGGFLGRTLLAHIGASGALGVGAGIRFLIAVGWLFVPGNSKR